MPTATITSKGQITLPKAVREHLHVDQGDRVEFVVETDGAVQVRRLGGSAKRLFGLVQRPEAEPLGVEEMDEERDRSLVEDDERVRRAWRSSEGEG